MEADDGLGRSIYNILGDRIARRTFEESGNYVVRPYRLQLTNKTTPDQKLEARRKKKTPAQKFGVRKKKKPD